MKGTSSSSALTFVKFGLTVFAFLCYRPANAVISVISELTNQTRLVVDDLPAQFIPDRYSFYGLQVIEISEIGIEEKGK